MASTLSDDELFEKMRSKKNIETDNSDDINDIKKYGYDYYKILGVEPSTEIGDIKRKVRHKIA